MSENNAATNEVSTNDQVASASEADASAANGAVSDAQAEASLETAAPADAAANVATEAPAEAAAAGVSSVVDSEKKEAIGRAQIEDAQNQVDNVTEITSSLLDKFGIDIGAWVNEPWFQAALIALATVIAVSLVRYIGGKLTLICASKVNIENSHLIVKRIKNSLSYTVALLGMNLISYITLSERLFNISTRLIHATIIIIWIVTFVFIGKSILRYLADERVRTTRLVQPESLPLWQNTLTFSSIIVSIYLIMSLWGINMSALVASAGIMGIAIGFAAKDTLANLISGVFIIADRPYKIGDYVVLDTLERGKITHIGLRSTRMITRDDIEITIPNSIMGNTKIINESGGINKNMRVRAVVRIVYKSDVSKVTRLLLECLKNNTNVLTSPIPRVRIRELGPSGLTFELLCWIHDPELRGLTLHDIYQSIHEKFNQNNIEFAHNKMDVYMKDSLNDDTKNQPIEVVLPEQSSTSLSNSAS